MLEYQYGQSTSTIDARTWGIASDFRPAWELLTKAMEAGNEEADDMLFQSVYGKGIEINGEWLDWEQIKHLWESEDGDESEGG